MAASDADSGDGDGDGGREDGPGRMSSSTSSTTASHGDEFQQPFAPPPWKKPHSSSHRRRHSWRSTAFHQQRSSKYYPFQSNPMHDSLQASSAPFSFQRRRARIDWRSLHSIDLDQIIRETDVVKLESVLDTVTFGDIQGEDTRNFTEANFMKLFRLSQLMVEYLLHMQDLFHSQKTRLLEAGGSLFKRAEKFRLRCVWQHEALCQSRRDLKQAKKAHYCPFCEKVFESSMYLDMHISRRHSSSKEHPAEVAKKTELLRSNNHATSQIKPALKAEVHSLQTTSQVNHSKDGGTDSSQVTSLKVALKESNKKLRDVQQKLDNLQKQIVNPRPSRTDVGNKVEDRKAMAAQEKLRELEVKFGDFESQIKQLGEENSKLLKELNAAYSEVSGLKSEKRRFIRSMDHRDEQVEQLQQQIEELRRSLKKDYAQAVVDKRPKPIKDYAQAVVDKRPKPIKDWLHEVEDFHENQKRLRCEESQMARSPVSENPELSQEDPVSRRFTVDTMLDADEEEIPPDKEKWLRLHPYTPLDNLPYVVARYPHSPALFLSKRNEVSKRLDKMLRDELQKFGIPPNAEGLSDAKYAVVATALEKQRAVRLSSAPFNDRQVMEFERSTVLWQIERAVHSRDMSILDAIFDRETDSMSGNDENVEDSVSEEEDVIQSSSPQSQRRSGYLDFEADQSARMSASVHGNEQPDTFRSRVFSQISDVVAISKNMVSRNSLDSVETHTIQVAEQLTTQRMSPLSNDPQPCNLILSAVSSPEAKMPEQIFEQLEESIGLGDWESDGDGDDGDDGDGERNSFVQSSPRTSIKEEHRDGMTASSKNSAGFSDLDIQTL